MLRILVSTYDVAGMHTKLSVPFTEAEVQPAYKQLVDSALQAGSSHTFNYGTVPGWDLHYNERQYGSCSIDTFKNDDKSVIMVIVPA